MYHFECWRKELLGGNRYSTERGGVGGKGADRNSVSAWRAMNLLRTGVWGYVLATVGNGKNT